MEKKIEDYLHLYLGCLAKISNKDTTITDYITGVTIDMCNSGKWTVKPILRPLSDIKKNQYKKYSLQTIESLIDSLNLDTHCFCPSLEDIPKLLKESFDLFGLEDAGIAMYKSKR